jgi:hypothetical protein
MKSVAFSKVALCKSVSCLAVLAACVASIQPVAALDFKILFNQVPGDRIGTIHPDGSVTYGWFLRDGRIRGDGEFEVEGLLMDLEDNLSRQIPSSIEIVRADHDPSSIGIYNVIRGNGFDVSNGAITRAFWMGLLETPSYRRRLIFTPKRIFSPNWAEIDDGLSLYSYDNEGNKYIDCACSVGIQLPEPGSSPQFNLLGNPPSPSSPNPVPGPFPVLGALGGYQVSRRLRKRIREARASH